MVCPLVATYLHRDFIGTSSEPHRNLAEGILKEERSVIEPLWRRTPKETRRKGGRKAVDKYSKSIPRVYKKTKEILIINY